MKNDDNNPTNLETWIEPGLAARIVAWTLGEASAFEVAELERLVAEQPELAAYRRRIEAIHALAIEAARPDATPLRLSPARREKLLATLRAGQPAGATSASPPIFAANPPTAQTKPATKTGAVAGKKTWAAMPVWRATRRRTAWERVATYAAACLVLGVMASIIFPTLGGVSNSVKRTMAERQLAAGGAGGSGSRSAVAMADDLNGPGDISNGIDSFAQNGRARAGGGGGRRQSVMPAAAPPPPSLAAQPAPTSPAQAISFAPGPVDGDAVTGAPAPTASPASAPVTPALTQARTYANANTEAADLRAQIAQQLGQPTESPANAEGLTNDNFQRQNVMASNGTSPTASSDISRDFIAIGGAVNSQRASNDSTVRLSTVVLSGNVDVGTYFDSNGTPAGFAGGGLLKPAAPSADTGFTKYADNTAPNQKGGRGDSVDKLDINGAGAPDFKGGYIINLQIPKSTDADSDLKSGKIGGVQTEKLADISAGTLVLSGSNSYTGGTFVNLGTLALGPDQRVTAAADFANNDFAFAGSNTPTLRGTVNAVAGNRTISVSGGTFGPFEAPAPGSPNVVKQGRGAGSLLPDAVVTAAEESGIGTDRASVTRTVTVSGTTLTVAGAISGTGFSLTKAGAGTLTLTGANTFTGGVTLNSGKLDVDGKAKANLGDSAGQASSQAQAHQVYGSILGNDWNNFTGKTPANAKEVAGLVARGRAQFNGGDLEAAQRSFDLVLGTDGLNSEAQYFKQEIEQKLQLAAKEARESTSEAMLLQVTRGWELPSKQADKNNRAEPAQPAALETSAIPLNLPTIQRLADAAGAAGAARPATSGNESEKIQRFLQSAGVSFAPGSGVSYDGSQLIVQQTPENVERIRNILGRFNDVKQVSIDTKFLEVTQGNLKEMGANGIAPFTSDQNTPKADVPVARPKSDPAAEAKKKALAEIADAEVQTSTEAVSTFSLHVSDVSFKLAQTALAKGQRPDPAAVRPEEFYNAFDYGDPSPAGGEPVSARIEQSAHPVLQQRNLVRIALRVPATGRSAGQPLRLTVLLDTSGSMERADRVATVRAAMAALASLLGADDMVTLIGFARTPRLLAQQLRGTEAAKLVDLVARTPFEGGTNMEEALKLAGDMAHQQQLAGAQNRIVLITDGAANLGDANPEQLARMIAALRQSGIALDACGVGASGLDDEVLEALTRKGDGRYYLLNSPEDADAGFARRLAGAFRPAAENVKVQVHFNPARVASYRLIGFEQHRLKEEDFHNDAVTAAQLAAEEAAVALYQVEVRPDGDGELGDVAVRFRESATGNMIERTWPMLHDPAARSFDQATPTMQLAGTAALLAEKLRGGAVASLFRLDELAPAVNALRGRYANETNVQALVTMYGQARRMLGE